MDISLRFKPGVVVFYMSCVFFLVEPFQGYIYGGDISKAGTNIIAFCFIALFALLAVKLPEYRNKLVNRGNVFLVTFGVCFLLLIFFVGAAKGAVRNDFFALFRSLVLGYFVYCFCLIIPSAERRKFLFRISFFVWLFVFLSIVLGSFSGYGLYSYAEHSTGYKFYYPSLNELSFVFFSSFLVLFSISSGTFLRVFYVVSTLMVFLFVGNKSFVVLFFLSLCCYFWFRAEVVLRVFVVMFLLFFGFIIILGDSFGFLLDSSLRVLIYILGEFSAGSSKLAVKLSYLNPISALISERDTLFLIARDIYVSSYGLYETIFGAGFTSYGYVYGELRGGGGFSFSEIDLVDIFMSYGLLGVFFLLFVLRAIYSRGYEFDSNLYMLRRILVVLFFVTGSLTGHIYLMGFPVFFFCCYAGLCSPGSPKRDV